MTREKYRDNDDVRDPLEGDDRTGGSAGTKGEARGDARENIGNHSRNTAANPTPDGKRDQFDETLEQDDG